MSGGIGFLNKGKILIHITGVCKIVGQKEKGSHWLILNLTIGQVL
jgi:hypothetical protein